MKLTDSDIDKIKSTLEKEGFPAPSDIKITQTADGAETGILRYNPNSDARDGVLGAIALESAGLNVDNDGDPRTASLGVDYNTDPISVVIMVREPLFLLGK